MSYFDRAMQTWQQPFMQPDNGGYTFHPDYVDVGGGMGGFRPQVQTGGNMQPAQQAPMPQMGGNQSPSLAQMFQQGQQPNQLARMFGMWQR